MNAMSASILLVLCIIITITESRYPYDDTYRPGDIVPNLNERRDDGDGRYPITRPRVTGSRGGYPGTGSRGGYPGTGNRGGYPLPGNGGYPIPGILGGGFKRDRPYDDYRPNDSNRRRRRTYLPARGLGGYKRNYDNYDYDYGKYRRQSRNRGPALYSNDDFSYGDYSD